MQYLAVSTLFLITVLQTAGAAAPAATPLLEPRELDRRPGILHEPATEPVGENAEIYRRWLQREGWEQPASETPPDCAYR